MTQDQALIHSLKEDKAHLYDASVSKSLIIEELQSKVTSLEEQIQGLQSILDLKQQEISVLESKVGELEYTKTCEGCKHNTPLGWNGKMKVCTSGIACIRQCYLKDKYEEKQN